MILWQKKGQMVLFVLLAVALLAGVVFYFLVKERVQDKEIPIELAQVFSYYQSCVEDEIEAGVSLAQSQGGHVYVADYIPGSEYAPFSSQLNFLGFPIPYWFYVSGNGIIGEQVPSKNDMELELEQYIEDNIGACDFEQFYEQGFILEFGEPNARVRVNDESVAGKVEQSLTVKKGENSARKTIHEFSIGSKLGKLYGIARKVYDKEKEEAFLENYSIDVLRLYAPVDGVEISCSPKVWKARDLIESIEQALEYNIGTLTFRGGERTLSGKGENYFVIDEGADAEVRMIYSRAWPSKIEIIGEGVKDELLIAEPVGNQQGLGVMGFCYAPYHFVYDMSYPVLFQVYEGEEFFQFPVTVIIDKNLPREAELVPINEDEEASVDVCDTATQDLEIKVYDVLLQAVDANISYTCFDQQCRLGETREGILQAKAPACLNGYLHAKAEGYADKKQLFSSNEETSAEIILDREFDVKIILEAGGEPVDGNALVSFSDTVNQKSVSAFIPETKSIRLSEGLYDVRVYVYGNTSVKIPESTKRQCQEIQRAGILGLFGSTKEECFDITIPETNIEYALIGGGRGSAYLLSSELEKGTLQLIVDVLSAPKSLEELQYNFEAVSEQGVEVNSL